MTNTILLLVDHARNRQLLHEWLSTRYTIIEIVPPVELSTRFDLAIIDGLALDRLWSDIHERKVSEQPVYMPVLFITNRQDVKMVTRHLWKSIDELIWAPIEKFELLARVEVLLRARNLSLELEEANRLKMNFLAMISHELRTPLTTIKGFSSTILSTDVQWSDQERHDFTRMIESEADHMHELVEQLLDLSRLQAGAFAVKPSTSSLQAILESNMPQITALATQHSFTIHIPDDLPLLEVDSTRIGQVMVNLIGNASKFAPHGTEIRLEAAVQKGMVRVMISDQGPGIPPHEREIIFEAFRQLDKSTNQKGAGLGLAICKGIVQAHGGKIWVDGDPYAGTQIHFTLPIHNDTP